MLKNILSGNKDSEKKEVNDEELKQLRDKFKEIVSDSPADVSAKQQPNAQPAASQPQNQQLQQPKEAFVDPERVEENERITNLIMQQIKELIEIDNNLNVKIKEIETKLRGNMSNISDIKNVVDKFHQRLEFIEKNMEKFMGLYEVVTNRFNPFIEKEEENIPAAEPASKKDVNIPDVPKIDDGNNSIKHEPAPEKEAIQPQKSPEQPKQPAEKKQEQPELDSEGIITKSGIIGKVHDDQLAAISMLIGQILESLGDNKNQQTITKIIESLTKYTNELVVNSIKNHTQIAEDDIKEMMKKIAEEVDVALEIPQADVSPEPQKTGSADKDIQAQAEPIQNPEKQEEPKEKEVKAVPDDGKDPLDNAKPAGSVPDEPVQKPDNAASETAGQKTAMDKEDPGESSDAAAKEEKPDDDMVDPEFHFVLPDGKEIKSIKDLKDALETMDDNTFSEHVNEEKNDFANWIGLVKGDWMLAEKISHLTTREDILSEVENIQKSQA